MQGNQIALKESSARVASTSFSGRIAGDSIEADCFVPRAGESEVERAEMKSRAKL